MFQGVEVTIGAESEPLPRGHDCSPSAEKHMIIVLAIRGLRGSEHSRQSRASHGGDWRVDHCHLLGVAEQVAGNPSDTESAFRQLWEKYRVDCHPHDLSSVFMTVGVVDTVHLGRSPSAEKHDRIGVGHETALEGIWRGTSL